MKSIVVKSCLLMAFGALMVADASAQRTRPEELVTLRQISKPSSRRPSRITPLRLPTIIPMAIFLLLWILQVWQIQR
jgi:hypothetical protein